MKLNLFSSDGLHPDFLNVDKWTPPNATPENFQKVDLAGGWPWPESSVEEIRAYDGPEHLVDKIHFMNECWFALKPGGLLDIQVPDASEGDGGHCDPTHVSYWNRSSFEYFMDQDPHLERFGAAYGVKARFKVESLTRRSWNRALGGMVWIINVRLRAVK